MREVAASALFDILSQRASASPVKPPALQARILKDMLQHVRRSNPFEVGDLVEQIAGFGAYNLPAIGSLALVTEILPQNISERVLEEKTTPRDDMVVLALTTGDRWVEFAVESWRFKKYEGAVE